MNEPTRGRVGARAKCLLDAVVVRGGSVVALDAFLTESSRQADVVLPVAAFAEKPGTTTNFEGRVSPLAQKVTHGKTATFKIVFGTSNPTVKVEWQVSTNGGKTFSNFSTGTSSTSSGTKPR